MDVQAIETPERRHHPERTMVRFFSSFPENAESLRGPEFVASLSPLASGNTAATQITLARSSSGGASTRFVYLQRRTMPSVQAVAGLS